jgi:uncharacterized membrane protein
MTADIWALASTLLLAVAIVAGIRAWVVTHNRWRRIAVGAQLGALGALLVALALSMVSLGRWSPFDLYQLALSLAVASLAWGLVFSRVRDLTPDPVLSASVLVIALTAALAMRPGGPPLHCVQRDILFGGQWLFFVLGGGSATVAASTALGWAIRWISFRNVHGWDPVATPGSPLLEAALGTSLSLGAGLVLGIVWAWQTYGSLSSGDPRQGWMASAGLVAVMSLVAWQIERRSRAWAAALAGIAGVIAVFGLLAVLDVQRLLGAV